MYFPFMFHVFPPEGALASLPGEVRGGGSELLALKDVRGKNPVAYLISPSVHPGRRKAPLVLESLLPSEAKTRKMFPSELMDVCFSSQTVNGRAP